MKKTTAIESGQAQDKKKNRNKQDQTKNKMGVQSLIDRGSFGRSFTTSKPLLTTLLRDNQFQLSLVNLANPPVFVHMVFRT